MRNKLAGERRPAAPPAAGARRRRQTRRGRGDRRAAAAAARASRATAARTARSMSARPRSTCRLQREAEALDRRVAGRSHVIARTFDRVCAVLDQLGYLDGDTVTAEGRRLAAAVHRAGPARGRVPAPRPVGRAEPGRAGRLRVGADVRVAPGRRRGPAAAARAARSARCSRRWSGCGASWTSSRATTGCRSCASPTSASPGRPTRGRRARRWRTCSTRPDLTPGDFVRAVKQLIDLLDQIAAARRGHGATSAATAGAPSSRLRRGVVAYSSVQ